MPFRTMPATKEFSPPEGIDGRLVLLIMPMAAGVAAEILPAKIVREIRVVRVIRGRSCLGLGIFSLLEYWILRYIEQLGRWQKQVQLQLTQLARKI